jgi:hypothetical protein
MSNLNIVDEQASDIGGELVIVEVGLVIAIRGSLLIFA